MSDLPTFELACAVGCTLDGDALGAAAALEQMDGVELVTDQVPAWLWLQCSLLLEMYRMTNTPEIATFVVMRDDEPVLIDDAIDHEGARPFALFGRLLMAVQEENHTDFLLHLLAVRTSEEMSSILEVSMRVLLRTAEELATQGLTSAQFSLFLGGER